MNGINPELSIRQTNGRGFTLVELLVVISIIALLVAILFPALNKAHNQAKTAICQANRQGLDNEQR